MKRNISHYYFVSVKEDTILFQMKLTCAVYSASFLFIYEIRFSKVMIALMN